MRAATERAAMRRGCVWPILPWRSRPMSSSSFGSCVVLPEPVSPQTITTGWRSIAARISSRRALIGSAGSKEISLIVLEHPLDVAGDQVDLDVDRRPGFRTPERGGFQRMRDEEHLESVAVGLVHREAHAVDADRAL